MALETGTYIHQLNVANPTSNDGASQGDDHLRLIKATLKNTFTNIQGQVTANQDELNKLDGVTATTAEFNKLAGATASTAELNKLAGVDGNGNAGFVPQGGIIMWSGTVANIPAGWAICDGANGTPNLTGRFVVHADADTGGTYNVGDTGGANDVSLTVGQMPSHTHAGSTSSDGGHTHTVTDNSASGTGTFSAGAIGKVQSTNTTRTTSNDGSHSHTFTTDAAGSGQAHENRPPYYALAYIMKL